MKTASKKTIAGRRGARLVRIIALLPAALVARPCLAAWPHNPGTSLPVCTAAGNQNFVVVASDGTGGAFLAWQDYRNGATSDIYAQHVLATGAVTGPANGVPVCTAANNQST